MFIPVQGDTGPRVRYRALLSNITPSMEEVLKGSHCRGRSLQNIEEEARHSEMSCESSPRNVSDQRQLVEEELKLPKDQVAWLAQLLEFVDP